MNRICVFALVALFPVVGCSQAVKHAQAAYDRSTKVQDDITMAFVVKTHGLIRIVATEANSKEVEKAKVALLRSQLDGSFTPQKAEEIMTEMGNNIMANEPQISKSFAWLAFLLQQSERAKAMMGNVDFYLQSQHSIFEQLSGQAIASWKDVKKSLEDWKSVIGDKGLPQESP